MKPAIHDGRLPRVPIHTVQNVPGRKLSRGEHSLLSAAYGTGATPRSTPTALNLIPTYLKAFRWYRSFV